MGSGVRGQPALDVGSAQVLQPAFDDPRGEQHEDVSGVFVVEYSRFF
ncbi:hypothetical protein [Streptomyces europaeiscabiei]|nr:hypothetical protein [Streptomyces europaeiscabiei]